MLSALKRHSRREPINDIVCSDFCATQFVRKTNLKDVFYLTAKAWDQLTPKTIDNCWSHALKGVFNDQPANEEEH